MESVAKIVNRLKSRGETPKHIAMFLDNLRICRLDNMNRYPSSVQIKAKEQVAEIEAHLKVNPKPAVGWINPY